MTTTPLAEGNLSGGPLPTEDLPLAEAQPPDDFVVATPSPPAVVNWTERPPLAEQLRRKVDTFIEQVSFAKFPFENYDGGISAHTQPERSGVLLLTKDGRWQFHPEDSAEYFYGGLLVYAMQSEEADAQCSKVLLYDNKNSAERAGFVLPTTGAAQLQKTIEECQAIAAARVRETLDLTYEKQLELMQQVKTVEKGRQDILTACGRIKLQAQQLQQAAAKLQDQGMRAVAQNHKDLAKEAVARRSGILTQLESLSKQMGVLVQQKQRLDATLKVLNSRVSWLQCPAAAGKIELVAGIDDVSEEEPASGPASRTSQSAWWLTPGVFRGLGFAERLTVNETEYHGGWSGHPQPHGKTNILEVDRRGIGLRGFKTIFTIPWDQIVDVDIEGPESAAKKVTAGRVLALGVFALAAKKKFKSAIIIVTLRNGDQAVFESHKALPHEISPKLTPLVAQVRKWASADHQQAVPDAPTNAPQVSLGPSVADELTKLAKLRTEGILTEEEFAAQKAKLLS